MGMARMPSATVGAVSKAAERLSTAWQPSNGGNPVGKLRDSSLARHASSGEGASVDLVACVVFVKGEEVKPH